MNFKKMKVKTKLLLGFGVVIFLSVAIAVFAWFALSTVSNNYQNKFDYSQYRVKTILNISTDVMNLRRITTAINAYSGDTGRQEGYATESANVCAVIYEQVDKYIDLARNDPFLNSEQRNTLISMAEDLTRITEQYKRDLIDVNIAYGMDLSYGPDGNKEALVANSAAQGGLISTLQATIDEMETIENELIESVIATTNSQANLFLIFFAVIAVVIVLVSICLALVLANNISKPLIALSDFFRKAGSTGDISSSEEENAYLYSFTNRSDEIGQVMGDSGAFIDHIINIADSLEAIADGDLTVQLDMLSAKDTLGTSIQHMVDNLNNMFGEINSATVQVSTGSKQIADGAQTLAQGSTEQAASIQQLSSSIHEISERTKENAATADKTAKLSETIKGNAEKGSHQMDDMMTAVKDINEASHSISKIIKTIDDIAFQTNILALNAAVEAARAGQHGKGFAVVAEEVRNLASKSAEAAKDTGTMIQNSMDKAELGTRIAGETAASLSEIVSGINESSQLIAEIAKGSEEQSAGIEMINTGIDQVAQVVQQNSATAEESAAASQEMSGQSDMLQQLITQFKLKNSGVAYRSLPAAQ